MKLIYISALIIILTFFSFGYCADTALSNKTNSPDIRDAPIWDRGAEQESGNLPVIEKISDGVLQFGKIIINKHERLIKIKGFINMAEGLVEYLACTPMGKLHESVLVLDVVPYNLQIALLLINLEPGNKPLDFQGAPGIPEGDPVELWVSWKGSDNKIVSHEAGDLILNMPNGKAFKKINWVFTGSQVIDGKFMAQIEHSIVSTYHDPFAIIDHTDKSGSNDNACFANKNIIPQKGTPVEFIIKKTETKTK